MKDTRVSIGLLIIIIIILISGGYIAGFFFYRECEGNIERQSQFTEGKFREIEDNLKGLYSTLENTIDENRMEKRKVLSKIDSIKETLQDWEGEYKFTMSKLRAEIESLKVDRLRYSIEKLQDDIKEFRLTTQDLNLRLNEVRGKKTDLGTVQKDVEGIDLGRISVKEQKKVKRRRQGEE